LKGVTESVSPKAKALDSSEKRALYPCHQADDASGIFDGTIGQKDFDR
jgi:hypothetical protein